jgi:O-methyltransferase
LINHLRMLVRNFYTELLLRTRLGNYALPRWRYNFSVPQLVFLCDCIEKLREIPGSIVEIGCAIGSTSLFLKKFMDAKEIEKNYICIDTFKGFLEEHIEYEARHRDKDAQFYKTSIFRLNKKEWLEETMRLNGVGRVQVIEADASEFDYSKLGAISFSLLDVDLYLPTSKSLPILYECITPGGMIVVDDCNPKCLEWDGAWQAYSEFMDRIDQPVEILLDKLGIIRKCR